VLHERHITDFDGNFAEWESVSTERRHAASVKAAEEESLRRVQEKKKTARRDEPARDTRAALRNAQKRVSDLELEIQSTEARVEKLTRELEDPELYTRPAGVARAKELGIELDRLRAQLEAILEQWSQATEALDALATRPS
jgi:ATPase subunit of ABC transporter with duplicated ATPase domains